MDSDDIAVLNTKVVTHNTVDTGASVIEIVIGEDNQHSVLALLALNENCITTEKLESLHGVVREGNHRVIIVNGVGNTAGNMSVRFEDSHHVLSATHIKELGFFFFFRIAVEVSSSCN